MKKESTQFLAMTHRSNNAAVVMGANAYQAPRQTDSTLADLVRSYFEKNVITIRETHALLELLEVTKNPLFGYDFHAQN